MHSAGKLAEIGGKIGGKLLKIGGEKGVKFIKGRILNFLSASKYLRHTVS